MIDFSCENSQFNKLVEHKDLNVVFDYQNMFVSKFLNDKDNLSFFEQDELIVLVDGSIVNIEEIKSGLSNQPIINAENKAEVVWYGFRKYGTSVFSILSGGWTVIICDKKKKVAYIAVDQFGIHPLYCCQMNNKIYFSSKISLLLSLFNTVRVDIEVLFAYIIAGMDFINKRTFYDGITRLLPGTFIKIHLNEKKRESVKYYNLSEKVKVGSSTALECFEQLLRSAQLHLKGNKPIATFLSGGIDSSTISAICANELQKMNKPLTSLTIQVDGERDESNFAKVVAKFCGLNSHYIVKPNYEDFREHIDDCLRIQEEPVGSPSIFLQYWALKTARELGIEKIIDGQGGDEVFLGYQRFYSLFFKDLFKSMRWFTLGKEFYFASKNSDLDIKALISYLFYFNFAGLRRKRLLMRTSFLKDEYLGIAKTILKNIIVKYNSVEEAQIEEITLTNLPHLLQYAYRNSKACCIEIGFPYLDYRLVESATSLLVQEKIKNGFTKYTLRKYAESILPYEIAWRKNKIGFEAPESFWLTKHKNIIKDNIENSNIINGIVKEMINIDNLLDNLSNRMLWRLYNIAVLEKLFNISLN